MSFFDLHPCLQLIINDISYTDEGQKSINVEDWCRIIFKKLGRQVVLFTENKFCCSSCLIAALASDFAFAFLLPSLFGSIEEIFFQV